MAATAIAVGDATRLLERESVLAELASDVAAVQAGAGRLAVIEGPAGIGKTAVVRAIRSHAVAAGMALARARGAELEREYAFGVVRQLFEPILRTSSPDEQRRLFSGRALPAAGVLELGESGAISHTDQLAQAIHGLYWLVLNLAAERPLLILIDDAHWADPPSLRFLSYLAGRLEGTGVLAVVAVRRDDRCATDDALVAVAREDFTRVVQLSPLSAEATLDLLQAEYAEGVMPEFGAACLEATGGNPFFLRELVRALRADAIAPVATEAARVAQQGPPSVARSVLTRVARVSPAAVSVARALAVLGSETSLPAVARLSTLDQRSATTAVDLLAGAGITLGSESVAFVHPIVQAAIYRDIPAGEREHAHRRAARLLDAEGARGERVAAHLLRTRPARDRWVTNVLVEAAEQALHRGAPESAVTYLSRALAEPPDHSSRRALLALLGRAEALAHRPGAVGHLIEAMDTATTPVERGELALQSAKALMMMEPDSSERAVEILVRSIAELSAPTSALSVRLQARLLAAAGLKLSTRPIHAELLEAAYIRPLGDDSAARLLYANLAFWTVIHGRISAGFATLARHAGKTGRPADLPRLVAERAIAGGRLLDEEGPDSELFCFATAALYLGESLDRADYWLERAIEEARTRGSVLGYALTSAAQAEVAYRRGDLEHAETHARAAAAISPQDGAAVLVNILIDQGHLDEADRVLDPYRIPADADHLMLQPIRAARARLRITQGRISEGTSELLSCADWLRAWPAENPSYIPWRSSLAVGLARRDEKHEYSRALALATEEVSLAHALEQPRALGMALRALGLVERGTDGIDILREAITTLEGSPARLELARALTAYGAALRRTGHRAEARRPLREGQDLAHQCGATAIREQAHQELVATGARPRRPALIGRDALTPTEARVAHMAAAGQSTPEIAQALFVTTKTIETHLSHAYQKLDIHGRAELTQALSPRSSRPG